MYNVLLAIDIILALFLGSLYFLINSKFFAGFKNKDDANKKLYDHKEAHPLDNNKKDSGNNPQNEEKNKKGIWFSLIIAVHF